MLGDIADFVSRQRQVLPNRWFADEAPTLDAVLAGFGSAWSAIFDLIQVVRAQTRIATATSYFIDLVSNDFFGATYPRKLNETDPAFKSRLKAAVLRGKGTRASVATALEALTGQPVTIFEPTRPADTGGYSVGGVGYCTGGGWGCLNLPFQSFVTVRRPQGGGIALLAGYGTGGLSVLGNLSMAVPHVTDAEIYAMAASVLPLTYHLWMKIEN